MVLLMRPATIADAPGIEAVILSRSTWLEDRGWPSWRSKAKDLASQAENTHDGMWVLEERDVGLVGCTTVLEQGAPWGWTPEELAESAYYLYSSVTDPAYRRLGPGTLMACWAVHRAAENGKEWVRRGCTFPGLARYYERQGFRILREVRRAGHTYFMMGRRAEKIPALSRIFADPEAGTVRQERRNPL
jgi:GNAT superfamily N-acetyltransferase